MRMLSGRPSLDFTARLNFYFVDRPVSRLLRLRIPVTAFLLCERRGWIASKSNLRRNRGDSDRKLALIASWKHTPTSKRS